MNELIKQTLLSKGWEAIEAMLRKEIADLKLVRNINTSKRYEDIAIEAITNAKAANKINNGKEIKKQIFR